MREMIRGLTGQLAWAAAARPEGPSLDPAEVLVCGMGGSAISGEVASVAANRRVTVHRSYGLPAWAAVSRPLVAIVSYSGTTEESLDAHATAVDLGLDVVTLTSSGPVGAEVAHLTVPGGLQPRAAFGYLGGGLLQLLHAVGAADDPTPSLSEAGDVVSMLLGGALDGPGAVLAADLADELSDRFPLIYGAPGLTGVAAYRWKTQLNENAKAPAATSLVPELDHNELAGWRGAPAEARCAIVALRDADEDARIAARHELTRELTLAPTVGEVWSQGESPLARLLSLTTIGDLVSLFIAERADVDPVEVDVLTTLKRRMGALSR